MTRPALPAGTRADNRPRGCLPGRVTSAPAAGTVTDMTSADAELITFAELVERVPLSARTIRDVIRELGWRPAPGRRKLLFNRRQVAEILDYLAVRESGGRAARDPAPMVVRRPGESQRAARTRETRALLAEVRGRPGKR